MTQEEYVELKREAGHGSVSEAYHGGSEMKVYVIEYYLDYATRGIETILSTEQEAIKYLQKHKCELPDSDYQLSITQKNLFTNHEKAYRERHD